MAVGAHSTLERSWPAKPTGNPDAPARSGTNSRWAPPPELNADPLSGDLFLFTNRRRTRAKVLLWDGTGLCIYQKRIERGRFASLWRGDEEETVEMTLSELALFFEGSTLVGDLRLSPSPTSPKVLASFLHETQPC